MQGTAKTIWGRKKRKIVKDVEASLGFSARSFW